MSVMYVVLMFMFMYLLFRAGRETEIRGGEESGGILVERVCTCCVLLIWN